jgi:hypothetical protein
MDAMHTRAFLYQFKWIPNLIQQVTIPKSNYILVKSLEEYQYLPKTNPIRKKSQVLGDWLHL